MHNTCIYIWRKCWRKLEILSGNKLVAKAVYQSGKVNSLSTFGIRWNLMKDWLRTSMGFIPEIYLIAFSDTGIKCNRTAERFFYSTHYSRDQRFWGWNNRLLVVISFAITWREYYLPNTNATQKKNDVWFLLFTTDFTTSKQAKKKSKFTLTVILMKTKIYDHYKYRNILTNVKCILSY